MAYEYSRRTPVAQATQQQMYDQAADETQQFGVIKEVTPFRRRRVFPWVFLVVQVLFGAPLLFWATGMYSAGVIALWAATDFLLLVVGAVVWLAKRGPRSSGLAAGRYR